MTTTHSSWYHKFKAFGPGILMASAAIGGSHIVASTQAGALYGWQLAIIVILVNIFKYPFFRFGTQYTLEHKHSLIEGYEEKGKIYLWVFFIMNIFSAVINVAAIGILTAAILANILKLTFLSSLTPAAMASMINLLTTIVLVGSLAMLVFGGYKLLDSSSKFIVISLTVATITVVDGYSRANAECLRLIMKQKEVKTSHFNIWMIVTVAVAMVIVFFFAGNVAAMMNFAMIFSFVSAPVYSYLNFSLVKDNNKLPVWLWFLSVAGIIYLAGFTIFFLVYLSGILK